jgi:hypothetical protein
LAALQALHHEAELREQLRQWHLEADAIEAKAKELAGEMRQKYPEVTTWIVDFLKRKAVVDAEVQRLNSVVPGFESRRLIDVELLARGIDSFGSSQPVHEQLKVPALVIGSQSSLPPLWPLVPQSMNLGMLGIFPQNGSPSEGDGEYYDLVFDEANSEFVPRRKADAPASMIRPAPPILESLGPSGDRQRSVHQAPAMGR